MSGSGLSGPEPGYREHTDALSTRFATVFAGRLLLAGAGLTLIISMTLGFSSSEVVVYGVCAVAIVGGIALLALRGPAPKWVLYAAPSASALLICFPMAVARDNAPTDLVLLAWPVLYSGYLLPEKVTWWTLGSVVLGYMIASTLGETGNGLSTWVELTTSTTVTVLIITRLRRRTDELERELADQARTDHLTGLDNRRGYSEALSRELLRHRRSGLPVSLLAVDVDHFKRVNDTWGHAAGDDVLRALGSLLASQVRGSDTVGRVGGEEFGVIMPDVSAKQARRRAQALLNAVSTESQAWPHRITVSIGVATVPTNATNSTELLAAADAALYRAKAGGRNQVQTAPVLEGVEDGDDEV